MPTVLPVRRRAGDHAGAAFAICLAALLSCVTLVDATMGAPAGIADVFASAM